jgi:hypothetical protein
MISVEVIVVPQCRMGLAPTVLDRPPAEVRRRRSAALRRLPVSSTSKVRSSTSVNMVSLTGRSASMIAVGDAPAGGDWLAADLA